MANRLLELESTLSHSRGKMLGRARSSSYRGRDRKKSHRRGRTARSLGHPVNYQVPGIVPALRQPSSMTCWATVFTMLNSWKQDMSMSIENALGDVGKEWVDRYKTNTGLSSADKVDFVAAAGLVAEHPQSFSVDGWADLLRSYGPIWVTTDEAPGLPWAIHARVITGIAGDGTPGGTRFTIIDPATGTQTTELISVFVPKYEEEVRKTGHMRIQVLHWPNDAKVAVNKALGYTRGMSMAGGIPFSQYFGGNGNTAAITPAPAAPGDLKSVVDQLVSQGADETELKGFLRQIGADFQTGVHSQSSFVVPFEDENKISISLPGSVVLDGYEAIAFRAALGTIPVVGPFLTVLPSVASRFHVTIGMGPAVSGGIVAGGGLGAGLLFAPGNKIGFYGSASGILGAIASISATMQITVIKGGPSNFEGSAMAAGVSVDVGAGPTIGAHALFANGKFIGLTAEVGVTAGLSPFEAFAQYQYTATTMAANTHSQASRLSESLYGTGEHVLTGMVDLSHLGSITPTYPLKVNGVTFAYGEIIAMGDLYESHSQMVGAPKSELKRLKKLIGKSTKFFDSKIKGSSSGSDVQQGQWQSATSDRYLKLAEDNYAHFAPSSSTLIAGYSSSKTDHKKEWERYHQTAINAANAGTNSNDLDDALVINAFGDHFLTDAFAAGHLFNKDDLNEYFKSRVFSGGEINSDGKKMLDEIAKKAFTGKLKAAFSKYETYEPHDKWWTVFNWNPNIHKLDRFQALLHGIMRAEPDIVGKTLVAKVVHDKLNEYPGGVPVTDANGNHWNLTGDDSLDQANLEIIQEAVMQSITNIVDAVSGTSSSMSDLIARVWDRTPRPTSDSQNMIKELIDKYTNPLESELTDRAAKLLQNNFQDLLEQLEDRKILKKA